MLIQIGLDYSSEYDIDEDTSHILLHRSLKAQEPPELVLSLVMAGCRQIGQELYYLRFCCHRSLYQLPFLIFPSSSHLGEQEVPPCPELRASHA